MSSGSLKLLPIFIDQTKLQKLSLDIIQIIAPITSVSVTTESDSQPFILQVSSVIDPDHVRQTHRHLHAFHSAKINNNVHLPPKLPKLRVSVQHHSSIQLPRYEIIYHSCVEWYHARTKVRQLDSDSSQVHKR